MSEKDLVQKIRQEFSIPMMKAKIVVYNAKEKTYDSALEYLKNTNENWCSNILDYKDSDKLKALRN